MSTGHPNPMNFDPSPRAPLVTDSRRRRRQSVSTDPGFISCDSQGSAATICFCLCAASTCVGGHCAGQHLARSSGCAGRNTELSCATGSGACIGGAAGCYAGMAAAEKGLATTMGAAATCAAFCLFSAGCGNKPRTNNSRRDDLVIPTRPGTVM